MERYYIKYIRGNAYSIQGLLLHFRLNNISQKLIQLWHSLPSNVQEQTVIQTISTDSDK